MCPYDPAGRASLRLRLQLAHVTRFVGILFIQASLLWFASELLNQGGTRALLIWLDQSPRLAFLNLGIFFSFACLLAFATNRLDASAQVGLLLLVLPIASVAKEHWLLQPLVPTDLRLVPQAVQVLGRYASPSACTLICLGAVGAVLLLGAGLRRIRVVRLTVPARLAGIAVSLLLPAMLYAAPHAMLDQMLHRPDNADLKQVYSDNGFLLSFVVETYARPSQPPAYSKSAIYAVLASLPQRTAATPASRPDIVVVLSESFWDPSELANVQFSTDPAPNYHALRHKTRDLRFLSPVFGGHTANVEFELLTGFSLFFEPEGAIPFNSGFGGLPMPSIARHFKSMGYAAKALHTYHRDFYFRDSNYLRLGFDSFQGDEIFLQGQYKGLFLADGQLGDRIQSELDHATSPIFLMAVTMENHGPFPASPDFSSVQVTSPVLNSAELTSLQHFASGIHDADAMLGKLVAHLQKSPRPTVLVFFGDHLPAFGPDLAVYRTVAFADGSGSPADQLRLHSAPVLLWANFPLQLPRSDETISPNLLWSELLPALGMDHPFYSDFLSRVRLASPGLSHAVSLGSSHTPLPSADAESAAILQQYELLHYDIMSGNRYSLVPLFGLGSFFPASASQ